MIYLLFFYTHYTLRGGASGFGASCGSFCINASGDFSSADWRLGAALSFKPYIHIMLFVVVLLAMVPIVVCFMLLLTLLILMHTGSVVLL